MVLSGHITYIMDNGNKNLNIIKLVQLTLDGAGMVPIDSDVYLFGGKELAEIEFTFNVWPVNDIWTLSIEPEDRFIWTYIKRKKKTKAPCPRCYHTGWEYAQKLWIFGGTLYDMSGFFSTSISAQSWRCC